MTTGRSGPDRRAFLARALKGAVFTPPVIETLAAPAFVQNQLSPKQMGMMMGKATGLRLMGTDPGKVIPPPWLQAPTPPPPPPPSRLRGSSPGDD